MIRIGLRLRTERYDEYVNAPGVALRVCRVDSCEWLARRIVDADDFIARHQIADGARRGELREEKGSDTVSGFPFVLN